MIRHHEIVGINVIGLLAHALEHPRFVDPLELDARLVPLMHRLDFNTRGIRHERAHHHAGAIAERMHAKKRVG